MSERRSMELTEITQACKTFLEVVNSEDFKRGLDLMLDRLPGWNREAIMGLFDKIGKGEDLTEDEKFAAQTFLKDTKVTLFAQSILDRLRTVSVNVKAPAQDVLSFSDILRELFSENGYDKLRKEIMKLISGNDNIELVNEMKDHVVMGVNRRIERLRKDKEMDITGGKRPVKIVKARTIGTLLVKSENVRTLSESDVTVGELVEREITVNGEEANFRIVPLELRGLKMIGIEIPEAIMKMKLSETTLGQRLMNISNEGWFPNIDMDKTVGEIFKDGKIVRTVGNLRDEKGNIMTDITSYYPNNDTDITREAAKLGLKPESLEENIVLAELVKHGLGDKYIDYRGYKADSDEKGNQEIRKMNEEISKFLGIEIEYVQVGDTNYVVRQLTPYVAKNNETYAVLLGNAGSAGCVGGPFSVSAVCAAGAWDSDCGVALSV